MINIHKLLIMFLLSLVICANVFAKRVTSFEKRPLCEESGGVWRQFGNACGDGCRVKFDNFMMCAQALTYSCDCLEDGCFDGEKCVKIADYKYLYQEIKAKEKALLDKQRQERESKFKQNRVRILQRLQGGPPNNQNNNQANQGQNPNVANPQNNQKLLPPINGIGGPNGPKTSPINVIVKDLNENKNRSDVEFKIPPFFQKNHQDKTDEVGDEKNENNDNNLPLKLPKIPLP